MTDPESAIGRGCAFLAAAQGPDGLWHDSGFPTGAGSDWVTAYVARCLWTVLPMPDSDDVDRVYEKACRGLARRQRRSGGWAYRDETPTDAESTAWALICLLDRRDSYEFSTSRGSRYLQTHQDEGGGFRLFASARDWERVGGDVLGLQDPQPCVTGAVVRALVSGGTSGSVVARACDYLERTQGSDGLWRSALWTGTGAPTYLALSALDFAHRLGDETRAAARRGVAEIVRTHGAYELAAALIAMPRLDPAGDVQDAVARLVAEQHEDGSWTPTGRLRTLPRPEPVGAEPNPGSTDLAYRGRLLMTVTAVTALVFSGVQASVALRAVGSGADLQPS